MHRWAPLTAPRTAHEYFMSVPQTLNDVTRISHIGGHHSPYKVIEICKDYTLVYFISFRAMSRAFHSTFDRPYPLDQHRDKTVLHIHQWWSPSPPPPSDTYRIFRIGPGRIYSRNARRVGVVLSVSLSILARSSSLTKRLLTRTATLSDDARLLT